MNRKPIALLLLIAACSFAIGQGQPDREPSPPRSLPRVETGITEAGKTAWKTYRNKTQGICVEVDTRDRKFTKTPNYVISLHGDSNHWDVLGTASVYDPTPTGFKVYLRWQNRDDLSPAYANEKNWRVAWIAVEP